MSGFFVRHIVLILTVTFAEVSVDFHENHFLSKSRPTKSATTVTSLMFNVDCMASGTKPWQPPYHRTT